MKKLNIFVRLTREVAEIQGKEADARYKNGNDSIISNCTGFMTSSYFNERA
jgi:hypothetical protein